MMYDLNGKPVVSDRFSAGRTTPAIDTDQGILIQPASKPGVYKFTRPLKPSDRQDKQVILTRTIDVIF
jgi:hypothetical protein